MIVKKLPLLYTALQDCMLATMLSVRWMPVLLTFLLIYGTCTAGSPNHKTVLFLDGECPEQEGEAAMTERISAVQRAVQDVNNSSSYTLTTLHKVCSKCPCMHM